MRTPRFRTVARARREAGVHGKKGPNGRSICLCGTEIPKGRKRWCSDKCYEDFHWNALRNVIFRRDKGVCSWCGLDTVALQRQYGELFLPHEPQHPRFCDQAARKAFCEDHGIPPGRRNSDWWDADHIIPLSEGGANARENIRTLCIPCHQKATRELRARIKERRLEDARTKLDTPEFGNNEHIKARNYLRRHKGDVVAEKQPQEDSCC